MSVAPQKLLGVTYDCNCGRTHTVSVDTICYQDDALEQIPAVLRRHAPADGTGPRVNLIADTRTFAVAGGDVEKILHAAAWQVHTTILPDGPHGAPVCDDITHESLQAQLPPADLYLAVGAGVVNDITKWLAFDANLPYAVVATAATMNGFTAANVAPALKGVKSIIFAQAPVAVFAVPAHIQEAPFKLTSAGFGDVIAKPISTADWRFNHLFCDEYFCPDSAEIITALEPAYFDVPQDVAARQPAAIKALFDALLYSGIAMTVVGSSAPASGGEHMLSHTLDMMATADGSEHDLHGRQVGVGVLVAAALYDRIFQLGFEPNLLPLEKLPADVDASLWGRLLEPVRAQYEAKKSLMAQIRERILDGKTYRLFLDATRTQLRTAPQIKECLQTAGAAHTYADLGFARDRMRTAITHMHEIRKRPTVVDLAHLLGILPHAADAIIDQYLSP